MLDVYTVIGFRPYSFVSPEGRRMQGVTYYVTYPMDRVNGVASEKISISESVLEQMGTMLPQVGSQIHLYWNKYGKVNKVVYADTGDDDAD